jgi:3-oxoadipate enol-lactonase
LTAKDAGARLVVRVIGGDIVAGMPTIQANGRELFYERGGDGPPLLLVMGMGGGLVDWGEEFLAPLRDRCDVICFDHRGVGRSQANEDPFSLADLAADAIALLDALSVTDAHVAGISMGGMISQEIALHAPERVLSLSLGCTWAGGPQITMPAPEVAQRMFEASQSGDREHALSENFAINVSAAYGADPANFAAFCERALRFPTALSTTMLQLQAVVGHDASARLASLTMPVQILHGTDDQVIPYANADVLGELIPAASRVVYEGVGHCFFWERPHEAATAIADHVHAAAAAAR